MLRRLVFPSLAALCFFGVACGDSSESTDGGGGTGGFGPPEPLPALSKAPLTTEVRIATVTTPETSPNIDPRSPDNVATLLEQGYGDIQDAPGEPVQTRTLDGSAAPPPGANAKLLTRFVHLSDIQLADDESPARVVNVDVPLGPTDAAFRPQEGHECRILNAAVRTINRVNEDTPLDLVVLGGDNADNAQSNEVDWVLSILTGAPEVSCDSGADDDPVPGPNNDPKDPFIAEGLHVPFRWVNGNHDVLNQGNFPPIPKEADYLATYASVGTRDWSQPGGPVFQEPVVEDDARAPLTGAELLAKVLASGDGHGIPQSIVSGGRAFYTFDASDAVRFIVMDTTAPTGSADGLIHQSEVDDFLVPALEQAVTDGKYVIVTSHHIAAQLTDGGGFGGVAQDDAFLGDDLHALLSSYPNVIMHLAGHTHHHRVSPVIPTGEGTPYWEVETSALADFPHQMRVVEVWDLDNGNISIRLTSLDYQTENDPVAEEGRHLAVMDFTSGWSKDGSGEVTDRNVELYIPLVAPL